ncbi:hypothetical protein [Argonema antarcticum]|uniref:hypothetical protein n=1 Tax=Argonema antarcticum TaxID=2942763 RepID=UPI00201252CA|nr:hypothetical protein [Argonema antarcticum]MCL1475840.1 hypothetical protein [Argonema antarcticum A004/B2]
MSQLAYKEEKEQSVRPIAPVTVVSQMAYRIKRLGCRSKARNVVSQMGCNRERSDQIRNLVRRLLSGSDADLVKGALSQSCLDRYLDGVIRFVECSGVIVRYAKRKRDDKSFAIAISLPEQRSTLGEESTWLMANPFP